MEQTTPVPTVPAAVPDMTDELTAAACEAKNQYLRDYRRKNRERLNAYHRAYYAAHRQEKAESNLRYYARKIQRERGEEPLPYKSRTRKSSTATTEV